MWRGAYIYMHELPVEIWTIIASYDERSFAAVVRSVPSFARSVSTGALDKYKSRFGHQRANGELVIEVRPSTRSEISMFSSEIHRRYGVLHRLDGPALIVKVSGVRYMQGQFVNGYYDDHPSAYLLRASFFDINAPNGSVAGVHFVNRDMNICGYTDVDIEALVRSEGVLSRARVGTIVASLGQFTQRSPRNKWPRFLLYDTYQIIGTSAKTKK